MNKIRRRNRRNEGTLFGLIIGILFGLIVVSVEGIILGIIVGTLIGLIFKLSWRMFDNDWDIVEYEYEEFGF